MLTGDLAAVTQTLALEPRYDAEPMFCTTDLRPTDGDLYLIALSYPDGTVWVSAPGQHCDGATNGVFSTTANLRAVAAASYRAGSWVANPRPDRVSPRQVIGPCERGSAGRLGQDAHMVPDGVSSLDICVGGGNANGKPVPAHHLTAAHAASLVQALNSLPTRKFDFSCTPLSTGQALTTYRLYFHYAIGPDVDVAITVGCRPAIDNSALQATSNGSVIGMVQALVR